MLGTSMRMLKRILPLLGLLIICAIPSHAQTFVRASTSVEGNPAVGTLTNTAGNTLIDFVYCYATPCTITVSDTVNGAHTAIANCTNMLSAGVSVYVFERDSIGAGANTITATVSATSDIYVAEYNNMAASALDKTACSTSSTTTSSVTTTAANEVLIAMGFSNSTTPSVGAGYASRWTSSGTTFTGRGEDQNVTSTGTYAGTIGATTAPRGIILITMKQAVSGSAASMVAGPSKIAGPAKTD
jgi:hypothetical protein